MKRICGFALSLLLLACAPAKTPSQLLFEDAWVRAMPPGSMMTAGFGRLVNQGSEGMVITGWSSTGFGDVSLHRTEDENGVSRMRSVPQWELSAGEELLLEPGGFHLMFMKPVGGASDRVQLQVELADGSRFGFELPVERR